MKHVGSGTDLGQSGIEGGGGKKVVNLQMPREAGAGDAGRGESKPAARLRPGAVGINL